MQTFVLKNKKRAIWEQSNVSSLLVPKLNGLNIGHQMFKTV